MKLNLTLRGLLSILILSLTFSNLYAKDWTFNNSFSLKEYIQQQDTVEIDTTGNLPYPFEDNSVFSKVKRDSSKLYLNEPDNIKYEIEYDPITGQYVFYEKVGNLNYRLPKSMSLQDYIDYDFKNSIRNYWQQQTQIQSLETRGGLIPKLTIGSKTFSRIFGGNTINIQPQGYVEVSFGYQRNVTQNLNIPERLRTINTFDFDEKIQMSVMGQIGTKMNMRVNYNTEATFDYENKMRLEYTGNEDEIIQSIEAGNVSLPLNGTLINGASNLFGIKADMQFGRLSLTTLFSQHKGETQTVETEGGAQITNYEVSVADYDANRHFFLSHYFRDHYNDWLSNPAVPITPINISKIEVWVTNRSGDFTESRNILALQDLGEHQPHIYNNIPSFGENYGLTYPFSEFPSNKANLLYKEMTNNFSEVREFHQISSVMSQFGDFKGGEDFDQIESARKLNPSEYNVNTRLGYISLKTALNSDEVLAVAYSYIVDGEVLQVGEFSNDGIDAPKTLLLKMLKGTNLAPQLPTWDLMMKNIYNLDAYTLSKEEFVLNVVYQDDSTGSYINYIDEGRLKGDILLRVLNLDNVNKQSDPYPDGQFDYLEGITVNSSTGRIIFPVVEPFGDYLASKFNNKNLAEKYAYTSLYDSSRVYAEQDTEHNKFRISGSYKGTSGSDILIGSLNIAPGSVKVTAGGLELIENVDYTVDYTLGRVKVINPALLEAGTPIQVSTESEDLFSMQSKILMGIHANYEFSENFNLGATALYMHERPITKKVGYGEDPISNLMVGLDARYTTESMFLTKMVDYLPFYSSKIPSTIDFEAEVARLFPGHSKAINKNGTAYIDNFEGTQTLFDMRARIAWVIASTPQFQPDLFPEANENNSLSYGYNRAKLAYYNIDPLFLRNNSLTPSYIKSNPELQSNHFVREIHEQEIFPARETPAGQPTTMPVLNLAFYPNERGPYNFDANPTALSSGVNPDGTLANPESRWGGIMRRIENSDFETSNIEFIEFWLMDPFAHDTLNQKEGGTLYFNLGDVSEDILKDSRKAFEHGLPFEKLDENVDTTIWGKVPTLQSLVQAFNKSSEARVHQDVGLDGLKDEEEAVFFKDYINALKNRVEPDVFNRVKEDPASDNFKYFRGDDYDQNQAGILERYKNYNGTDGNSPVSNSTYPASSTSLPDMEDINRDNTLNEYERYYQYKVSLKREDLVMGENYITDIRKTRTKFKDNTIGEVTWYQFKIPIRDPDRVVGNIRDFKSIRFMRMFLKGYKEPVILRFATLDLVRSDWRKYSRELGDDISSPDTEFDVTAINIEENGRRNPINYVLPPGIDRVIDPANPQLRQMNEQAMVLKVSDLEQGDAKAAYKSIYMDFRRYKRLKLEVHAEKLNDKPLADNQVSFFIRLGSDYNYNYYEYEIPLKLTAEGYYNNEFIEDRLKVWPEENQLDIPMEIFTQLKLERNDILRRADTPITIQSVYTSSSPTSKNTVKIKGSPNLGNIQVVMMGIRNPKTQLNTGAKSVEVWVNEFRLSDFEEKGGWAANARVTSRLSDLGNVTVAGRKRTAGFGSISDNINSRSLDDLAEIDISTSVDLGKLLPEKANLRVPMYYGYSKSVRTPKYNPLEPDIELNESLRRAENKSVRDSINDISQDVVVRKSINFTNVKYEPEVPKEKSKLWDIENFALSYSFNEISKTNVNTAFNVDKTYRGLLSYNFNNIPRFIEPFKNVGALKKGPLKLIGDFNFSLMPTQLSYRTDLFRRYHEVQSRNITNPDFIIPTTYEKDFTWNRYFDLRYDLTRSLKVDFSSRSSSRIDEPEGAIHYGADDYSMKKDSILTNLWDLGRPTMYNHNINISYRLPLNKIKMLNFITSSVRYQGNYDWLAGPITADTINLGNRLQNSRNINVNTNINFTSIFNKVPYFNYVNKKYKRTGRSRYSINRRNSGSRASSRRASRGVAPTAKKDNQKVYTTKVNLNAEKAVTLNHKLNTKIVKVLVSNSENKPVKGKTKIIDKNTIEFIPQNDAKNAIVSVSGKPGDQSLGKDILDLTTRVLIGLRTVSINYSNSGGTVLPGYLPEPSFVGGGNYNPNENLFNGRNIASNYAPGVPFLLGWQDDDFARTAAEKGWITTDPALNMPFLVTKSEQINLRAMVEPIPDLRIDFLGNRTYSKNISEFYNYDSSTGRFTADNFSERGNFSMSILTFGTAFFKIGDDKALQSDAFQKFKENRITIARRLAAQRVSNSQYGYDPAQVNPETGFPDGYGPNSVEVMVPAFLAAYQGKSASNVSLGLFPSIKYIRPNWRIRYEGMVSKIPWLSKYMRSLNFTHGYQSNYSVGSFLTDLNYNLESDGFNYVRDAGDNFLPKYEFSAVNIMEAFNPLINVDIMWLGDLTTRAEIKRSRNLTLSFANNQLTEILSNEYTLGVGYRFKQMDLIIKTKNSQKSYSNDLNIRADFSYRKNKTTLRKIVEENNQVTAGLAAFTVKTTADYMLSDRFQIRLFFDKVINSPFKNTSYETSNTNIGVSFKFTLAQ